MDAQFDMARAVNQGALNRARISADVLAGVVSSTLAKSRKESEDRARRMAAGRAARGASVRISRMQITTF
jgi:hypothetical protein